MSTSRKKTHGSGRLSTHDKHVRKAAKRQTARRVSELPPESPAKPRSSLTAPRPHTGKKSGKRLTKGGPSPKSKSGQPRASRETLKHKIARERKHTRRQGLATPEPVGAA